MPRNLPTAFGFCCRPWHLAQVGADWQARSREGAVHLLLETAAMAPQNVWFSLLRVMLLWMIRVLPVIHDHLQIYPVELINRLENDGSLGGVKLANDRILLAVIKAGGFNRILTFAKKTWCYRKRWVMSRSRHNGIRRLISMCPGSNQQLHVS